MLEEKKVLIELVKSQPKTIAKGIQKPDHSFWFWNGKKKMAARQLDYQTIKKPDIS